MQTRARSFQGKEKDEAGIHSEKRCAARPGGFGKLSPSEAAHFPFKTAVTSGHQTACSSSRGWVASRGVTCACKCLFPEFSSTGVCAQLPTTGPFQPGWLESVWRSLPGNHVARLHSVRFGASVSSEHGRSRAWSPSMEAGRPSR